MLSNVLEGQFVAPCAHSNRVPNGATSKLKSTKATSCSNTRKSPSISDPWSFKWIKDPNFGDVGVVFSHKRKEKVIQQWPKATHNPSLISLRRVAYMPLKDHQNIIRMLKKCKKKPAAPSCSIGSENKECLDAKSSSTTSGEDWKNWISLHDKSNGGGKDIVDIGKAINL